MQEMCAQRTLSRSQGSPLCKSRGHSEAVKYFDSQKQWMRMGVLRGAFLISLRQPDSLFQTSSGKISFLFTCKSHCCASSSSDLTFPTAAHTGLLSANRHRAPIFQQPSAMHTHKNIHRNAYFRLLHLSALVSQRAAPGVLIMGSLSS